MWSYAELDFSDEPELRLHSGSISFDAGQGLQVQYGGRSPAEEMDHLLRREAEAYEEVLRAEGLPPDTKDYPWPTAGDAAQKLLAKIRCGDVRLWDGRERKVNPAVSKGIPGPCPLYVASMPGADGRVYNNTTLFCLEDGVGFGVVWEANWEKLWFRVWRLRLGEAVDQQKELLVLTKDDGSVGFNQSIEVAYMQSRGMSFRVIRAKSFLRQVRPLVQAAWYEDDEGAAELLRGGRAVELLPQQLYTGYTILHVFARNGRTGLLQLALEHNADVECRDFLGATALHLASSFGHSAAVRQLLAGHAALEAEQNNGVTALYYASQQGHAAVVTTLLEAGASQSGTKEDGATPLFYASSRGHERVMRLLLEAKAEVGVAQGGKSPLHEASQKGHSAAVQMLLAARADAQALWSEATPMDLAKGKGHTEVAKLLAL